MSAEVERIITRVKCSRRKRAHTVGVVVATAEGELELRITVPVAGVDGTEVAEAVVRDVDSLRYRGEGDDRERIHHSGDAWCEVCERRYPIDFEGLFARAEIGARGYQLYAEGAAAAAVKRRRRRWLQSQRSGG